MTLELYITIQMLLQSNGNRAESEALAELYPDLEKKWEEISEQAYSDFCKDMSECFDIFRKR